MKALSIFPGPAHVRTLRTVRIIADRTAEVTFLEFPSVFEGSPKAKRTRVVVPIGSDSVIPESPYAAEFSAQQQALIVVAARRAEVLRGS